MTQVCQKVREKSKTTSMNKKQSCIFVKRMLAISVSTITYMRNMFPEAAFVDKKLEDLSVKILSKENHGEAATVVEWMQGVYNAIEKEYLQTMILAIVSDPNDPMSVLETYTFGFTYTNGQIHTSIKNDQKNNITQNIPTTEESTHSARKLIRNLIILTHNMTNLPQNVFMTLRLLYYDEQTPEDYQPPGFVAAEKKDVLNNVTDKVRIKVGNLNTPYYSFKLRANTSKEQYMDASETKTESSVPSVSTNDEIPESKNSCTKNDGKNKKLDEKQSLWKKTLEMLFDMERISLSALTKKLKCTRQVASEVFKRLQSEKVISRGGQRSLSIVNSEILSDVYEEEFGNSPKSMESGNMNVKMENDVEKMETELFLEQEKEAIQEKPKETKKRKLNGLGISDRKRCNDSGLGTSVYDFEGFEHDSQEIDIGPKAKISKHKDVKKV